MSLVSEIEHYVPAAAGDRRIRGQETRDGVESSLWVTRTPFGYQRVAELHRPEHGDNVPAILYVHWYEPESPTSNRRQFEHEAKEMAKRGAACLLVETLWSDMDFFLKRTQADDPRNSVEESVNLRRALDFLLSQPGIVAGRAAYVGHDFGGMYGVLMGSVDRRPSHYCIMAATPRLADWYLYSPRLEGDARAAFIAQMAELDPIMHVARLSPAPILFQFGDADPHVPRERAEEFFAAAGEPKELKWYAAGHGLNAQATADRQAWLAAQLGL
jgi:dienelactone hydrolase